MYTKHITVDANEVETHFTEIANNANNGAEYIVTKNGKPFVKIIPATGEADALQTDEANEPQFAFEDIVTLDDKSLRSVIVKLDTMTLVVALKSSDEEVREKVFKNLTERARNILKEDIEFSGPISQKYAEEARQNIVDIVLQLEKSGDVLIPRVTGDELII